MRPNTFPLAASILLALTAALPAQVRDEGLFLAPLAIHAGGRSSVTVTAFDGATRAGADLPVTLRLLQGDQPAQFLASSRTGRTGHVEIPFDVPARTAGTYLLEAEIGGIAERLQASTTLSDAPAILIETDKPIYKPSQTIRGRVLLLDNALRPRAGAVEVAIHDAKGIRIDKKSLTANEYGVAPFDLDLASEVNFGVWTVRATAGGATSSRDVKVENYVLPRYELSARFDRSWVLVDDRVEGDVLARYFFGKPVEGTVDVVARKYVGAWEVFGQAQGTLSGGSMHFSLPPVTFAAGTPGAGGQGTISLEIKALDTAGSAQSITEVLTVSSAPVVLGLIARTSTLKPDMPAEVLVTTKAPDGAPLEETVSVEITSFGLDGQEIDRRTLSVVTERGSGTFSVVPPPETGRAEFKASAQEGGRTATASLELNAAWSPSSSFLSVTRSGGDFPARVGEEVAFTAVSTHPGTLFYDIYAGGRTVASGASEDREVRFTASADMAPKAKLVAYVINPDNEVSADTVPFEVSIPPAISIDASLSKEDPKPGDEVTLTVNAGKKAMVGLSIVDLSVLALGKSRLHLGEVFAELERRFLEPQAETHDEQGPPGPGGDFWARFRSPGALETLKEAGLTLVATQGVILPAGRTNFPWEILMEDGGPLPPSAGPGTGNGESPGEQAVRVRQFFPETWVWSPVLLTDDAGVATLTLTVPDTITGWRLSTVGSTGDGIGFGERDIVVFQDFFVEPDIPAAVTRGEEFPVRIQIYNYLPVSQTVKLDFAGGDWFDLLGEGSLSVEVPASSAVFAHFPIRPTALGEHRVELLASGSVLSDAVVRTVLVEPEGQPAEEVLNSVVRAGETAALDTSVPEFAVPGSGEAFLHVTPSPVAQTLSGVSELLNMPFGCGEQNMIFLAPDVEVLRYLRAIGELMPEARAQAEYFINVGYQRELTFGTDDGGFAAFGGKDGSLWLTAFVLSTFSGAREVRDIDEAVLSRAAAMLLGRQEPDGSFRTDQFLIHQEMDGGQSNLYSMTAYVAGALADYGAAAVKDALSRAAGYLRDRRSMVNDDAYSLAIACVALGKVPGFESTAAAVADRLGELAKRDGIGIHWEPYPIESTGYAAMALLSLSRPEAASAIEWLSTQRNSLGGYGQSTQDTVVAIRALVAAASKVRGELDLTLTVLDGEGALASLHIDGTNYDILRTVELPSGRASGLALRAEGSGSVGYQVARKFHVPGDRLPPPRDMEIDVAYDAQGIEVDQLVDVKVRVRYSGAKERTGMTIVDVGIPTGFQATRASLDALVSSKVASRIDIAGRKVILYLDGLDRGAALEFAFQVKALFPVKAEPPISRVYEYYDLNVQATTRGKPIVVDPPLHFIRGDVNSDAAVDISDAVGILHYLFEGDRSIACLDRADPNDDGGIDITDPILILNFLFLGGPQPADPFPGAGVDPTQDSLDC